MHLQTFLRRIRCRPVALTMVLVILFGTLFAVLQTGQTSFDIDGSTMQGTREHIQSLSRRKARHVIDRESSPSNAIKQYLKGDKGSDRPFPVAFQDDPGLVSYVRQSMQPPSPRYVPYNLTKPEKLHFAQQNQSVFLNQELLHGMREGFFVELGALDGETHSNTLFLERELGWNGLLIEPHPGSFKNLTLKRRKAYAINAGASLTNRSAEAHFLPHLLVGISRITNKTSKAITIRTFPLYTMLLAVNITVIDFLSLDVEGDELKVLHTIPWDKVKVMVMCIEIGHVEGGTPAVVAYMEKQGYVLLDIRHIDAWFANKDLLEEKLGRKLVKSFLEFTIIKQ